MRAVAVMLLVIFAIIVCACDDASCSVENCGDWGGSASTTFQDCIEGTDLVLRDAVGNEVFRCDDTAGANGGSSSCADAFAQAKQNYCSSH